MLFKLNVAIYYLGALFPMIIIGIQRPGWEKRIVYLYRPLALCLFVLSLYYFANAIYLLIVWLPAVLNKSSVIGISFALLAFPGTSLLFSVGCIKAIMSIRRLKNPPNNYAC